MLRHRLLISIFCAAFVATCGGEDGKKERDDSGIDSSSDNDGTDVCGDNVATGDELCDGTDLQDQNCKTMDGSFTGGVLACNDTCDGFDSSACTRCGNDKLEGDEICDGSDFGETDCASLGLGYTAGELKCNDNCSAIDHSECTTCGDGKAEGAEECDDKDLKYEGCDTLERGYSGGTLSCGEDCLFDVSLCTKCGDDKANGNEVCDGVDVKDATCEGLGLGYTGGVLICNDQCTALDDSACTTCGDDKAEGDEACDGVDLKETNCEALALGYNFGTLRCKDDCTGFDDSDCTICGDKKAETPELCDGDDLFGQSCASLGLGFTDGSLSCNPGCDGFVTTACTTCGDNFAESPEVCDGSDLVGQSCETLGYTGGLLGCKENCGGFAERGCNKSGSSCGNDIAELNEACDGFDIRGLSCGDFVAGQTGTVTCRSDCTLDLSGCKTLDVCAEKGYYGDDKCQLCELYGGEYDTDCTLVCKESDGVCNSEIDQATGLDPCVYLFGAEDPDCVCGNNILDGEEQCDGAELRGASCLSLGYTDTPGLACLSNCTYDTTNCVAHTCGDGVAAGKEVCDKTDLNDVDCSTLFGGTVFSSGDLACKDDCTWDYSGCVFIGCGDDIANNGEECDGEDLAGADCTTLGLGFFDGTLSCDDGCFFDTSECQEPHCGNYVAEVIPGTDWEQCDGEDLRAQSCKTLGFDYGYPLVCRYDCNFDTTGCGNCPSDDWADCNLNPVDACEVNLTANEQHCGKCDHPCEARAYVKTVECVNSACQIVSCQPDYYDRDGAYLTGCECHSDSYPNTCTNAANVGTVNYNAVTTRDGNLAEPGDVDWWVVTFQRTKSCEYSPKIVLSAGTLPIRMQLFPTCTSGAGTGRYPCKESNPNYSDQGVQVYEVESFSHCGYQNIQDTSSYNAETSASDGFFENTLPQVTYIRVYATGSSQSCMNYTLTFSN